MTPEQGYQKALRVYTELGDRIGTDVDSREVWTHLCLMIALFIINKAAGDDLQFSLQCADNFAEKLKENILINSSDTGTRQ